MGMAHSRVHTNFNLRTVLVRAAPYIYEHVSKTWTHTHIDMYVCMYKGFRNMFIYTSITK